MLAFIKKVSGKVKKDSGCCAIEIKEVNEKDETSKESCCSSNNDK